MRFIAILAFFPSLAFAQDFASRIEIPAGKLCVLTATPADSTSWRVINSPPDDNHQICDSGTKLFFSTGVPGSYWIIESAASVIDGKVSQKLLLHSVVVGNPPSPGPTPNPQPGPQPKPLPEGRFGLAEFTRQAVLRTPGIDRKLAAQFASNFGVIAAQLAAGTITTFADANAKLKARNQETAKGVEAAWEPVGKAIGGRLNELVQAKKLATTDLQAVQDALTEIRDGYLAAAQ